MDENSFILKKLECHGLIAIREVFIFKTKLSLLYKIDIEDFKKFELHPVRTELIIAISHVLEGRCLTYLANQTFVEWKMLKLKLDNFWEGPLTSNCSFSVSARMFLMIWNW